MIISGYTTTVDILEYLKHQIVTGQLVSSEAGCVIDEMIQKVKREKYHGKKPRKRYRS